MKKMLVIGFVIVAMLACMVACANQQPPSEPLPEAPSASTAAPSAAASTTMPPPPASTAPASTAMVAPPESSAVPPSSAVVPPSSSETAPPESSAPPATGGFTNMEYSRALNLGLSVSPAVGKMAGIERYEAWKQQFKHINPEGTREFNEHNMYNLIVELEIPREKLDEWHEAHPGVELLPEDVLDMIYAGDKIGVYQRYLMENTFMIGERYFTPQWLVEHSVEEYVEAGITYEILEEHIGYSQKGCITLEQKLLLEEKLEQLKNWKG